MIYLEKIEIKSSTFPGASMLPKGFTIECMDVNLLVGNQGCGKSTLLNLIQKNHPDIQIQLSDYVLKNGVDTYFFDTEKDNPRIKDPQMFTSIGGKDIGIGYGEALASRFYSHGEVLQDFIFKPLATAKDCVILLDEPESGLSITNQFKLIQAIKKAVEQGCQLFIATHCLPLIEAFDVISLEHHASMCGTEFISLIKTAMKENL